MPNLSLKILALAVALTGTARAETPTQTTATETAASPAAMLDQHSVDKISGGILKDLKLTDSAKTAAVRAAIDQHVQAVAAWHAQNDARLKKLWDEWAAARSGQKDEVKAAGFAQQIDAVYAEFQPQHDAFVKQLAAALTPAELEKAKDAFSKTPGFQRTYKAYFEIVPTLTDPQKAHIHDTLVIARDQAMDTLSKNEKIELFKKQKVKIQLYIDEQGYDWNKSYAAFAAKIKAQSAKKADPASE